MSQKTIYAGFLLARQVFEHNLSYERNIKYNSLS